MNNPQPKRLTQEQHRTLEQLDFTIGCQWTPTCTEDEDWMLASSCCEKIWMLCAWHRVELEGWLENQEGTIEHLPCGQSLPVESGMGDWYAL